MRRWFPYAAGGAAGAVAALTALAAGVFTAGPSVPVRSPATGSAATHPRAAAQAPAGAGSQPAPPTGTASALDIRAVLRAVEPGVVSITQFGAGTGGSTQANSEGTGMILDTQGTVLTNAHVVSGATAVSVQPFGQTTIYQAKILGVDTTDDVAVIRIQNPGHLTPVPLGQSAGVEIGDPVVAIGNALALAPGGPTVTHGIVSGLNRSFATSSERLTGMIQTDAALNPGNSGGPLADAGGKVIAMNTAISNDGQNIGFAIPVDRVVPLIATLRNGNVPARGQGFLGVNLASATSGGAQISSVQSGSPAAAAGLQVGDVITAIDGQPVSSSTEAADLITADTPGTKVIVTYLRAGATQTASATLGTRPSTG